MPGSACDDAWSAPRRLRIAATAAIHRAERFARQGSVRHRLGRAEKLAHVLHGQRPRDEVALPDVAPLPFEELEVEFGGDTISYHRHADRVRKCDQRSCDRGLLIVLGDIADECSVNPY